MLVRQKIIAQTFYRHTPFLTHDAQVIDFELGLYLVKATLHLATVREQGQHRAVLRAVNVHQQALQRGKIRGFVRFRHIAGHVHCHMSVEIIA